MGLPPALSENWRIPLSRVLANPSDHFYQLNSGHSNWGPLSLYFGVLFYIRYTVSCSYFRKVMKIFIYYYTHE
ncbi:MAG: hypothetical protein ACTSVC_05570 [Promethearchaeota archaeon]